MQTEIKIRGYHTDLFQHVNNARYLEFLEEGRWQVLDSHMDMADFLGRGYLFFVVNINISYKGQARFGDTVIVKTGLKKMGNKSAVMRQQVVNKATNEVCVDADVTFVVADATGRAVKLEGEVKILLEQIPGDNDF